MLRKVESIAPFDAKEIAIDSTFVAIVSAHNLRARLTLANAQSRLAAIAAVGADRAHMIHLPRPRLVAIRSRGERADWADIDAHAALFAVEVIVLIRGDDRTDAAILHAERPNVHAFAANAHAAVTKNAARAIEINHRRPLLLFLVVLRLHEFRFGGAIGERHVLQFAFAAGIAHRAIQGMVPKQQLDHRLARLPNFITPGRGDHALATHGGR